MDPMKAKAATLDDIMDWADEAMVSGLPKQGMKVEETSVEMQPAMEDGDTPAELMEQTMPMSGEDQLSEDDMEALMGMYSEDEEDSI